MTASARTIGTPFITDAQGKDRCPVCKADLTDDYIPGYGLCGGGIGTYWYCTSDDCDWFYKVLDADVQ